MPRRSHAQGRPGTRVIPADWNTTNAPVVAKTLRGACELRKPGTTQDWNADHTEMVSTPNLPYWEGPCRIQNLSASNAAKTTVTVEDREFVADYLIVLPLDVNVEPGNLVDVLAQPADVTGGDPQVAGVTLHVEHVVAGTERFERDVFCTVAH